MRSWILAAVTALALAACDRPAAAPEAGGPEVPPPAAPVLSQPAPSPAEEAAPGAPLLDAASSTAMAITGTARFGAGEYVFGFGQRYTVVEERTVPATEPYAETGDSWASLLQLPPETPMRVVRVTGEQVPADTPNGGLCRGSGPLRWIVTGTKGAGSDARTSMAAFTGDAPPGAASPERALCGTYSYMPAE